MKEKKKLIIGILLVLLTFIGVSYAYFTTRIFGDKKNVGMKMSGLNLIFTNGDSIEGSEIYPEDNLDVIKTFSVENETKNTVTYNLILKDLVNTFKTTGYLVYKITSDDGGYNMTEFEDVPKRSSASNTTIAYDISIPANIVHNYTIEIKYINNVYKEQNEDQAAKFSGKIYISNGTPMPTLTEAILRDNPTIKERTYFGSTYTATTTGTIFKTNKTEDESDVYYYAGNTTNNWVKFGKQKIFQCVFKGKQVQYVEFDENSESYTMREVKSSDECTSTYVCENSKIGTFVGTTKEQCNSKMNGSWRESKAIPDISLQTDNYWRIIRTNEDGGVRLLYSGTSYDSSNMFIGSSWFNKSLDDPMYVGYMYGTSGSLENNRTNENDSKIKTHIDTWYESNLLTNYDKYISKTAIYCNDRSTYNNSYTTTTSFNYASYTRIEENKNPTYKCGGNGTGELFEETQSISDKFSASTESGGNGQLKYPIALMTVDEISFAGGNDKYNSNYNKMWFYGYAYNIGWWTMTPYGYDPSEKYSRNICDDGEFYSYPLGKSLYVRPVISLNSCIKIKNGNGTIESPYEIDYDNSCK